MREPQAQLGAVRLTEVLGVLNAYLYLVIHLLFSVALRANMNPSATACRAVVIGIIFATLSSAVALNFSLPVTLITNSIRHVILQKIFKIYPRSASIRLIAS